MLRFILLHGLVEIDKKSLVLSEPLTGETQLRAKRTRIKILRAIADKNGAAGFSDIKLTTGLSTGSIYYHLERMGSYVTKDSKHYIITEEGLRLLREADAKYAKLPPPHGAEEKLREYPDDEQRSRTHDAKEPSPKRDYSRIQKVAVLGGLAVLGSLGVLYLAFWGNFALLPISRNASLILFIVLVAALASSFSFRGRRVLPQAIGYRGLMLSILSVAVVFSAIMFISEAPFSGASAPNYDNSMDALLSSYSLQWQVR